MSNSSQTFVHTPLENPASIRLFRLLPGENGTSLKCEFVEHGDPSVTPYEALSYAWGNAVFPNIIEVYESSDGDETNRSIPITKNLFDALQRLRSDVPRTLWVDALCINQDDLGEKGHQVANMGQIYRNARRVIVWLGEDQTYPRTRALLEQDAKNRWPLTVPEIDLGELVTIPW